MKIGIDFDRVLFNTDKFNELYSNSIDGLHHVENPRPTKHGVYCPEMHAELCGIDPEQIWSFFKKHRLEEFLFDDVKKLEDVHHDLVIVTRGNQKFQRMKLENTGILEKVDDYVIVQEEDKDVADIDILIDDREKELERADIPGILFNRPEEDLESILEKVKKFEA